MMFEISQKRVESLRQKYPTGTRVRLISMAQERYPVPKGTIGTVTMVDDIGTIHVNWDNHSSLGLVPGIDEFDIVKEGNEGNQKVERINITAENAESLIDFFLDDMISYIDYKWDEAYEAEQMTNAEAEIYLGHSVKGMTKDEINDEISEIKRDYYTQCEASKQEILDMFLNMLHQ